MNIFFSFSSWTKMLYCLLFMSLNMTLVAQDNKQKEEIQLSINKGIHYLITHQNKDGSWGTAKRTKKLNIYAPVPSAHYGFRVASTVLCMMSLIKSTNQSALVTKALEKSEKWLFAFLPRVRRANSKAIYNIWAHSYSIELLVLLAKRTQNKEKLQKIYQLYDQQIQMLLKYESVFGGWGYYDFDMKTQKPGGSPSSFLTATVCISLYNASKAGFPIPKKTLLKALMTLRLQQKPDFSYAYGLKYRMRPMRNINLPGGSLARSQACNLALKLWGDKNITHEVIKTWLNRLVYRNGWLDMGRKRPVPHESWFAVAGYFYYYGHFYGTMNIKELPVNERSFFQEKLAEIIMHKQEKNGSWFDYPLYDYGHYWGTAYALMSLMDCQ